MKIENDVPIPSTRQDWKTLASKLKVGQSIIVENNNQARCLCRAIAQIGNIPRRLLLENKTIRIWCVKSK